MRLLKLPEHEPVGSSVGECQQHRYVFGNQKSSVGCVLDTGEEHREWEYKPDEEGLSGYKALV